jgi:hypothetical protein
MVEIELCWKTTVHSRFGIDVPEVVIPYDPSLLVGWKAAYAAWLKCKRTDCSVWGDYRDLAESERLYLPTGSTPSAERFVEFHAALLLEQQGFRCWGGVQLFNYGKNLVKGQENTQAVSALWKEKMKKPWPNDVKGTLELIKKKRPRNPDIVAYHAGRNEWRFCEVKGDDRVDPYQTMALAILHLLTGAPVAIVRLRSTDRQPKSTRKGNPPPHEVEIAYRGATPPDWLIDSRSTNAPNTT